MTAPKRILFMAEAATLAHVIRPLELAKTAAALGYEVHFACAENDLTRQRAFLFHDVPFSRWNIRSQPSARFLKAADTGARLFDFPTLLDYAADDLRLFEQVRPDLVVGDFRWSLAASAPAYGVPHAALQNAYWSPNAAPLARFPLPEYLPLRLLARLLGEHLTAALSGPTRPLAMGYHLRPINRLRRRYGLPPFGGLFEALTHGDYTLYADLPDLVPIDPLPERQRYLGPMAWAPPSPLPEWWADLPADRPLVYVSLGSSGRGEVLPALLAALANLPLTAMLATAGVAADGAWPANVYTAEYLPGGAAAARAALVVGNGGSGLIYQALGAGVPVLGIPANMDQLLAMAYVERSGCGLQVRASRAEAASLAEAIGSLLAEGGFRSAAARLGGVLAGWEARDRFAGFLAEYFRNCR